jgi:hypothetical protein
LLKPVHPQVLVGRNPWWREAWEGLDSEDRHEVEQAVRSGRRARDHLLPYVYGLVALTRRRLRWAWLQLGVVETMVGVWVYFTCFRAPQAFCWLFVGIGALGLVAVPARVYSQSRRLEQAERANMWGRGQPRIDPNGETEI